MLSYCQRPDQAASRAVDNIVFRGRILWRDIATWLRAYLVTVSLQSDRELQEEVVMKLQSLPVEFGEMMRVFFGDRISQDYTTILSDYIMLFINIINAQVNGDFNAVNEYKKQIYRNLEKRAEFLSSVNPFWDKGTLDHFMRNFTDMTIQEINTFLAKQYKENIQIFERVLTYTSAMGDYLAQGISNYLTYSARQPKIP